MLRHSVRAVDEVGPLLAEVDLTEGIERKI
jgi:hypothetical protein